MTGSDVSVNSDNVENVRLAASVLLIRNSGRCLEIFMQHRAAGMAFAPGVTAFPGGGVESRDYESPVPWSGPASGWWAERFRCDPAQASATVCAAVRETFEECGVLLAGTAELPAECPADDVADLRREFTEGRQSIRHLLEQRRWVLRADMLRPWANWITPAVRPRRYDTRFFLAACPSRQTADSETSEATAASWVRPKDVLGAADQGSIQLMLPTRRCLEDLVDVADVASAFRRADQRPIEPIMPVITVRDGEEVVIIP